MRELRPQLEEDAFIAQVRAQREQGYALAFVKDRSACVAVAGYRVTQNLALGRFVYVDDLVTSAAARSRGYGSLLLSWLEGVGRAEGCTHVILDSGTQRKQAHRFYLRKRFEIAGFHFSKRL